MTRQEIHTRLGGVFREVFDDDTLIITDATSAKDIEAWDSIAHITLICAVEEAFKHKFSLKNILTMKNVGEMTDILQAGEMR
ncbi:MAG: acyl carrier protein [Desulfovibrio sp.]|jgi:acyl carrier protein|nr:acyl carrier protein [Desulfovibrio sp.]